MTFITSTNYVQSIRIHTTEGCAEICTITTLFLPPSFKVNVIGANLKMLLKIETKSVCPFVQYLVTFHSSIQSHSIYCGFVSWSPRQAGNPYYTH